ncbi:sigma-70 family RNA polymerase sigma factor [Pseudalkalibacillus caeni]|uniref:Sigma-70 family RNA polymerase sigma factor n=1 Tax=Exobacillus caeni TaxID=2574798 RepID=A0A5R9FCJ0_9BACL|nr:sigma-70 family RNA polymerase sigma factor [Pseudalkalibacillus caeni]TLS38593.1 sigma-70 family RNA polymerase sigma factor [Pseudalkalibacillus caeni]
MEERNSLNDDYSRDRSIESLVNEYGYEVYKLAFFYLKDKGKAEDIAQEVFVTCFEKLSTYQGEDAQIKNWLFKITTNKCKDYLRSWSYRKVFFSNIFSEREKSHEPTPEESVYIKESESQMIKEVLNLPIKYREIIILYYYQELKMHEIAKVLQITENTVKTRLRRGKLLLKKTMEGGNH